MKNVLVFIFVICYGMVLAQAPDRFYTTFGGDGDDIGYSAKQTSDGNYIIVGSTSSFGSTDVYLLKVNSMGLLLWQKNIGGFGIDVAKAVVQLPDSGFVIAGYTNSFGAGGYDVFLVRTDKNGSLVWQKTFGGTDWDFANDLTLTSNGNIAVVGLTNSFGSGQKDGMVLIYDYSGNIVWQKFYGGVENEELRSIISTDDGNLATVGFTESRGDLDGDGYFLKLNVMGDTLFTKTFGGLYKGYANDLFQNNNNEYVIAGAETYSLNGYTQSQMYCMSSTGVPVWENNYTKTFGDNESFVSVSNSTQLPYLSAFVRSIPVDAYKMQGEIFVTTPGGWLYKINDNGDTEDDYFNSVESTTDGGFVIVGSTESYKSKGKDIFFMKHDSTCFYYSSIVSTNENILNLTRIVYLQEGSVLTINFVDQQVPESVYLYDIYGKLILTILGIDEKLQVDLSSLSNSVFLIECRYKDGSINYKKFVKVN